MTRQVLQTLRAHLRKLDQAASPGRAPAHRMRFGLPEIDHFLPWGGLPKEALHEVAGPPGAPTSFFAAAGFAAALLARACAPSGVAIWCQNRRRAQRYGQLYGPGMAFYGLDPNHLLIVNTESDAETLWVMEEGLRSPAIQAVLGEVGTLDLTASRRLQLAAEKFRSPAFLLRLPENAPGNNAAMTRWHIEPCVADPASETADQGQGAAWRAALWRCRGGSPAAWEIVWKDEAFHCHMAGAMADRLPEAAG